MIGKLKGILTEIHSNEALIETTSGVTYIVFVGPSLLSKKGENVDIYTFLNVKEDELSLFGFSSYDEYSLFKLIKSVDGVGPKTAFGIVQSSPYSEIKTAIYSKDLVFFERIKGIGKKTAQKILLELSSKMGAEFELSDVEQTKDDRDVLDALKALGYKSQQIKEVLREIDYKLSIEEKIRAALQKLN